MRATARGPVGRRRSRGNHGDAAKANPRLAKRGAAGPAFRLVSQGICSATAPGFEVICHVSARDGRRAHPPRFEAKFELVSRMDCSCGTKDKGTRKKPSILPISV